MSRQEIRVATWGGMGDVVLLTAALREWKQQYPGGKLIVYCTSPAHKEILKHNPHIDALRLIDVRYRLLFVLWPGLGAKFGARLSATNYGRLLPSLTYRTSATRIIGEMLDLSLTDPLPELHLSAAEESAGRRRLAGLRNPVSLHTMGAVTRNKPWPGDNWCELVRECPQYTFVQLGLKSEPLVAGAIDMRGLPLRQAFGTLKNCVAHVGPDSGLAHAASALKVPAVVLFGPSSPMVWGHAVATNLHTQRSCSPCVDILNAGPCPFDVACMKAIRVEQVVSALQTRAAV